MQRTPSVCIFIHSSKLEFLTSLGTLITGGCTAVRRFLRAASPSSPSRDDPAIDGSCGIFMLFRRLRFSAASSLISVDFMLTRPASEAKLSASANVRLFRMPLRRGLGGGGISASDSVATPSSYTSSSSLLPLPLPEIFTLRGAMVVLNKGGHTRDRCTARQRSPTLTGDFDLDDLRIRMQNQV